MHGADGGNGYIEDFVIPKLLRDVNVLPIWEGSGNIIVLDMLRAARKSRGLSIVFNMIEKAAEKSDDYDELLNEKLSDVKAIWKSIQKMDNRDTIEATAKPLFEQLIKLFEMALLIEEKESADSTRFDIALRYFARSFDRSLYTRNL